MSISALGVGALAGLTIIVSAALKIVLFPIAHHLGSNAAATWVGHALQRREAAADPHEQRDLLATAPPATLLAWRAQAVAGTALQFAAAP
jgi:hypothetical protein